MVTMISCTFSCTFPPLQDEEYAHQLQFEFDAMSYIQNRGEEVNIPLHGDPQSILTVSH